MPRLQTSLDYEITSEYEGMKVTWSLSLNPLFHGPERTITCPNCGGNCEGALLGFGVLDDPINCYRCNNTGKIIDQHFVNSARPPEELIKQLEKTWKEHWNLQQNQNFELK